MISTETTVCASPEQTSCELAGEVVILSLTSGTYYGLDAVGSRVWSMIQEPRRVRDLTDVLLTEYDVDRAQCEREVLRLLEEMKTRGLVGIADASP